MIPGPLFGRPPQQRKLLAQPGPCSRLGPTLATKDPGSPPGAAALLRGPIRKGFAPPFREERVPLEGGSQIEFPKMRQTPAPSPTPLSNRNTKKPKNGSAASVGSQLPHSLPTKTGGGHAKTAGANTGGKGEITKFAPRFGRDCSTTHTEERGHVYSC